MIPILGAIVGFLIATVMGMPSADAALGSLLTMPLAALIR